MSDFCSVFQHNINNKLTSCGTPSFPEGNVMHERKSLNQLQALDFTAAGISSYTLDMTTHDTGQDCREGSIISQLGSHHTQVVRVPKLVITD